MKVAIISDRYSLQTKHDIISKMVFPSRISFVDLGEFDTLSTHSPTEHNSVELIMKQLNRYVESVRTHEVSFFISISDSGISGQIYANKIDGFIAAAVSDKFVLEDAFNHKCNFFEISSNIGVDAAIDIINQILLRFK